MYWKLANCMAMISLCRYWRQAMGRRKPGDCGRMFVTIVRQEIRPLRRYGLPIHRIVRESIHRNI